MEGIQFIVNSRGQKKAVLIDLGRHGELWEDVYDSLLARRRQHKPRESFDAVKERLRRKGKLAANG